MGLKKSAKKMMVMASLLTALQACASTGEIAKKDQQIIKSHITAKFDVEKAGSDKELKNGIRESLQYTRDILVHLEKSDPTTNSLFDFIRGSGKEIKNKNKERLRQDINALELSLMKLQRKGIDIRAELADLEELKAALEEY